MFFSTFFKKQLLNSLLWALLIYNLIKRDKFLVDMSVKILRFEAMMNLPLAFVKLNVCPALNLYTNTA